MKTDRELLELAAKATGDFFSRSSNRIPDEFPVIFMLNDNPWNPLTDDGDALRLFCKLPGCELYISEIGVTVFLPRNPGEVNLKCDEYASEHNGDLNAAARRAIVRAAAAIGEVMP